MNKRLLLALVGTAGLLAAAGPGYKWQTAWRWQESTDNAYLAADITPIAPKVQGHVVELAVGHNQAVRAGEVLLRIDDRDYKARLAEAEAKVGARRAALANLDERLELQRKAIAQADANRAAVEADRARASADLDRSRALLADNHVSRQRFDMNKADAAKAAASGRAAAVAVEAARQQIAVLESERAMTQADLQQAEAERDRAALDLANTVVTAPVDGVVGNRAVQLGQFVAPGRQLLSLVPLAQVWVEANFKETQIGRMQPGQAVEVAVDAFPGQTFQGRVDSFAPASGAEFSLLPPENATGNFTKVVQRIPVRISLEPGALQGRLLPGMSALVTVDTKNAGTGRGGAALAAVAADHR